MASGMGVRGTMGRCYGFFQDLQYCVIALEQQKREMSRDEVAEATKQCSAFRSDYLECLHGEKTFGRAAAVARAEKLKAAGGSGGHGH